MPVKITGVQKGSAAKKAHLTGYTLLKIDGNDINDMLDYEFYSQAEELELLLLKNNVEKTVTVKKEEYEPLGCEFSSFLMDEKRRCKNKCIFCFVDQMPLGMRDDLYFKDDDERMSFLYGNYITLTNLTQHDVDRIIKMKISPINISVHTVDTDLRVEMMKNPAAATSLKYIDDFAQAGIEMNFQLVLCPGYNDEHRLEQSLEKLGSLYPATKSVAAVPVGLTRYRQLLATVIPYDEVSAAKQLEIMHEYGEKFLEEHGARLVYPSDEWYIMSKQPIPDADFYEDYPQLENGVGMWRSTYDEFMQELEHIRPPLLPRKIDVVTGEISRGLTESLCEALIKKCPRVKVKIHVVKNNFFGGNVNVSGLLTASDLVESVHRKMIGKTLFVPESMIKEDDELFLDNCKLEQVEHALNAKLCFMSQNGAEALRTLLS